MHYLRDVFNVLIYSARNCIFKYELALPAVWYKINKGFWFVLFELLVFLHTFEVDYADSKDTR